MKRRSKILMGLIVFITAAKLIDNRIALTLDQGIRMSGAAIEERLAELDLEKLRDIRA